MTDIFAAGKKNYLKILRDQSDGPDELDAVDPVALDHLPLHGTVEVDPPVDLHLHLGDPRDPRVQNDHPGVPSPDPTVLAQQVHGVLDAVVLQMSGVVDVIFTALYTYYMTNISSGTE